jgi:putative protein-disulfide isomerase
MRLYYVMDPMCSWCWGFEAIWQRVQQQVSPDLTLRYVLGGLAPDSTIPMPQGMQRSLQHTWRMIGERTGAEFNFEFWDVCQPRRATYPACRAVIAAGLQDTAAVPRMMSAIQHAYYLQARNPAETATLVALAGEIGLDSERFADDLPSRAVQTRFQEDLQLTQRLGVQGFPSMLFEDDDQLIWLAAGYTEEAVIMQRLHKALNQSQRIAQI